MKGLKLFVCLIPLLSVVAVDAQKETKWAWSTNNRNSIANPNDRLIDRRKYDAIEDLRDRYEVNEQSTRRPNSIGDDYYANGNTNSIGINNVNGNSNSNGRFGFNDPNSIAGSGYNSNSFGQFGPQGLGATPNNFNYPLNGNPLYGNQFNGPYNPGFGYPNNYKPGYNNNFYPNGGFPPNYGNTPYYPGGYYPNRYPYNPLGNNAANGILVGPNGPTGQYGRPSNYIGQNQPPFNAFNGAQGPFNGGGFYGGGPFNGGGAPFGGGPFNGGGAPFGGAAGFPPNGIIPFNSKAGSDIPAEDDDAKEREADKKPE